MSSWKRIALEHNQRMHATEYNISIWWLLTRWDRFVNVNSCAWKHFDNESNMIAYWPSIREQRTWSHFLVWRCANNKKTKCTQLYLFGSAENKYECISSITQNWLITNSWYKTNVQSAVYRKITIFRERTKSCHLHPAQNELGSARLPAPQFVELLLRVYVYVQANKNVKFRFNDISSFFGFGDFRTFSKLVIYGRRQWVALQTHFMGHLKYFSLWMFPSFYLEQHAAGVYVHRKMVIAKFSTVIWFYWRAEHEQHTHVHRAPHVLCSRFGRFQSTVPDSFVSWVAHSPHTTCDGFLCISEGKRLFNTESGSLQPHLHKCKTNYNVLRVIDCGPNEDWQLTANALDGNNAVAARAHETIN